MAKFGPAETVRGEEDSAIRQRAMRVTATRGKELPQRSLERRSLSVAMKTVTSASH